MARKTKVNTFDDLKEGLQDAAAYESGEPVNLRVTRIPARPKQLSPKEVRHIRRSLKASQALFATYLNVSANAVRSWEQGTRRPPQAALKLLTIAKKNPKALQAVLMVVVFIPFIPWRYVFAHYVLKHGDRWK